MISFILIVVISSPGIARGAGLVFGALVSLVSRSDKAFLFSALLCGVSWRAALTRGAP